MDFDLPSDRERSGIAVPPGMALAVAAIIAAGVTGLAVAGLTWTLDRPTGQTTGAPPDVSAFPSSSATASTSIDTPGYDEALGLQVPAPVPSGGLPVEGAAAPPTAAAGQEETVRRAAAARRPIGPTASVRSTRAAAAAATTTAAAPTAAATTVPGPAEIPVATDPATPGPADPAEDPIADPAADTDTDPDFEPTATETTAPQRRWTPPRRDWRDEPRQAPAPAPQWGGPFGGVPRLFPWG